MKCAIRPNQSKCTHQVCASRDRHIVAKKVKKCMKSKGQRHKKSKKVTQEKTKARTSQKVKKTKEAEKPKKAKGSQKPTTGEKTKKAKETEKPKTRKKTKVGELELYEVERIERMEYNKATGRCLFLVIWQRVQETDEPTWEPIENILGTPRLILDMESRMYKSWVEECNQENMLIVGWKKPLPFVHEVEPAFPLQYVMDGSEKLVKIAFISRDLPTKVSNEKVDLNVADETSNAVSDQSYCFVRFRDPSDYNWVHIGFIEYYFPTELAIFLYSEQGKFV